MPMSISRERIIDTADAALRKLTANRVQVEYIGICENEWGIEYDCVAVDKKEFWEGTSQGLKGYIGLKLERSPKTQINLTSSK